MAFTYKNWTTEEDNLLKKVVDGTKSYPQLQKEFFPNRTASSLQSHARFLKLENNYYFRKYSQDESFWKYPNEMNSYWAGLMAADGHISYDTRYGTKHFHWECAKHDWGHMEKFREIIGSESPIKHYSKKSPSSDTVCYTVKISIFSQNWIEDIEKNFNIAPQKCKRLSPPEQIGEKLLWNYLRGYIDGDGCINVMKKRHVKYANGESVKDVLQFKFLSASPHIINWIKNFTNKKFNGDKIKERFVRTLGDGKYHEYAVTGQKAVQMFLFMSKLNTPCLDRKWKNPEVLELVAKEVAARPEAYKDFI